ncbi:DUF1648 domain-containing protein [Bacillus sp. RAR_GA_16]|uniref:DUF1648 domain-containing protein n=1 Tax=Bacillus sp. RAR_GA_16 TaxID=2876774 RepID=UPI001CCD6994|nr:DUF1648 domain-containing protein [Bacillus sp. RAR_GA_16]MCA0173893.1 DUF1648 domain-containing protein [Bacillus sp. RAR_GA_16]
MEKRPRIDIEKSWLQKVFDLVGFTFLLLGFVYILLEWSNVPSRVPIHFNVRGESDLWGPKSSLIILPLTGVILWFALGLLERYPHVYNYVVKITKGNAEIQYRSAVVLIRFLKNAIAMMFAYLSVISVQIAKGLENTSQEWVLPIFLTAIFGAIIVYLFRSIRWR